jgi:hypothetical protein
MKKLLLLFTVCALIASCSSESEEENEETKEKNEVESPEKVEETTTEIKETPPTEETVSKDPHVMDWEKVKKAILDKDIPGVGAFASSDAVDSEMLIKSMEKESFTEALASASFADLVEEDAALIFRAEDAASTISIYFTKGESGLALDFYMDVPK